MDSQDRELLQLLADPTNQAILALLNGAEQRLSVTELADQLTGKTDNSLDETRIALHHNHLPRLAEAGLLEYDAANHTISNWETSTTAVDWAELDVLDDLLAQVHPDNGPDTSAVGFLEGREDVYEYGRELADNADDELFLIYASDDLLDEECLPHAERAIARGVEFYAGAKSRTAREFFRDCLPAATIWEPQLDWLYEQAQPPTVSRLMFADREHVVVGLWTEEADGTKTEVAMVGDGATNPLVVLVRELLGSRLDHLDYQSEDFLGELPFET